MKASADTHATKNRGGRRSKQITAIKFCLVCLPLCLFVFRRFYEYLLLFLSSFVVDRIPLLETGMQSESDSLKPAKETVTTTTTTTTVAK